MDNRAKIKTSSSSPSTITSVFLLVFLPVSSVFLETGKYNYRYSTDPLITTFTVSVPEDSKYIFFSARKKRKREITWFGKDEWYLDLFWEAEVKAS